MRGATPLDRHRPFAVGEPIMIRFFDIGDRARLPWRFHGDARMVRPRG
jgi:hypothetical protein